MKTCSVIVLVLLLGLGFAANAYAGDLYRHGGYVEPTWKMGLVNGKAGMFLGLKGSWLINHSISIGGGSYWLFDVKTDEISTDEKLIYLDMRYGGIEVGYVPQYKKKVDLGFHTFLGIGGIGLREHNPTYQTDFDNFYVIEPRVSMDIEIVRWFHLELGVGYFFALGAELGEITSKDISGPAGTISLKFGRF